MLELIKNAKLTQTQLAEKLNVSPRLVSYWCAKERKPNIFLLEKIASVLGVTMDEVIVCFKKQ